VKCEQVLDAAEPQKMAKYSMNNQERRSHMTLVAINVLMDPDAATVEKAQAINAHLRESYPDGFAFDANHAPHITLLQQFVRTADLDAVAKTLTEALRTEQSMNWECHVIGFCALADKDLLLAGIVIEPTSDLRRLQHKIIDAVAPFAVEKGTGEAFAPRLDGDLSAFTSLSAGALRSVVGTVTAIMRCCSTPRSTTRALASA
jgi:hypothetical protein